MAEYLDPRDGYTLVTFPDWQAPQPWWIEVPEGAEIYGYPTNSTLPYFHKAIDGQNWYYSSMNHNWSTSGHPIGAFDRIHWQRATPPEELPFIDDEPQPKPRERVYAVLGDDNCIRVPKLTADYLFNTVQALGFVSDEQKGAVLYHLNYLKVN